MWSLIASSTAVRCSGLNLSAASMKVNKCGFDYLRLGEEKNFLWALNPTADLLLLPNLQQKEHVNIFLIKNLIFWICSTKQSLQMSFNHLIITTVGSLDRIKHCVCLCVFLGVIVPGSQSGLHALRQRAWGGRFIELVLWCGQRSQHVGCKN